LLRVGYTNNTWHFPLSIPRTQYNRDPDISYAKDQELRHSIS